MEEGQISHEIQDSILGVLKMLSEEMTAHRILQTCVCCDNDNDHVSCRLSENQL